MSDQNFTIKNTPRHIFGRRLRRQFHNVARDFSYEVVFPDRQWEGRRLADMDREMDGVWQGLVDHVLREGADPEDLMRIHIGHDALNHRDIIVSLRRIREMTPDAVWGSVEKILQSYQTLAFDQSLRITVGVMRLPRGAGRSKMINLAEGITAKKSIVHILNKDMMCMARALVVCQASRLHKEKKLSPYEYERMRKDRVRTQSKAALELHRRAGVSVKKPCGLDELPAFESEMDAQVVVFGAKIGNRILYQSKLKEDARPIYYIYHTGDH